MILNGVLNFPSSQLLYIVCGYFVGTGSLLLVPTILVGALGNTIGNTITFLLVKKYEHNFARKILMLDEVTFQKIHNALKETFKKHGLLYIFFGKLIPSVKAFIPVLAGLSNTRTKITVFIFLIASIIWATVITSIGYFFGEHASLGSLSAVSLVIGLFIFYTLYKKVSKRF